MTRTDSPSPAPDPLALRHLPSLDSIRGAAVLMVLFFHGYSEYSWRAGLGEFWGTLASAVVGSGRFGVNVFFVLSGFLITTLLFKARERSDFYQNFYLRRILRIVPVYVLTLIVLKVWGVIDFRFLLAALLFAANFARIFGASLGEYGSLWSLAVEEHFYLLWPMCVRRLRDRTLLLVLLGILVAEPVLRVVAIHKSAHIDIHYKTPFVLDFLAYGALLAMLLRAKRIHAGNLTRIGGAVLGVGSVLSLLTIFLEAFHPGITLDALADLPFTWAACGVLLLGLKRDHTRFVRTGRTDSRGLLPFYGYISYGLYLINVLVYAKLGHLIERHLGPELLSRFWVWTAGVFLCIAASTAVAYLSRRYFEAPILHLKNKWQGRWSEHSALHPAALSGAE